MSRSGVLNTHYTWEDWAGIALGALAALQFWQDRKSTEDDLAKHGR